MPPRNDDHLERMWKFHVDILEKVKTQCEANALEIAVMKTKIAMAGAIAGSIGGLVAAVVIFFLKKALG